MLLPVHTRLPDPLMEPLYVVVALSAPSVSCTPLRLTAHRDRGRSVGKRVEANGPSLKIERDRLGEDDVFIVSPDVHVAGIDAVDHDDGAGRSIRARHGGRNAGESGRPINGRLIAGGHRVGIRNGLAIGVKACPVGFDVNRGRRLFGQGDAVAVGPSDVADRELYARDCDGSALRQRSAVCVHERADDGR